jgi:hypothetical protein
MDVASKTCVDQRYDYDDDNGESTRSQPANAYLSHLISPVHRDFAVAHGQRGLHQPADVCLWKHELTPSHGHGNDDLSLGVSFFEIPESFRDLTQGVLSIYDRSYFSGFK